MADRCVCNAPATNLVIYPDGSVRVCCISTKVLGNLHESTLSGLWHGHVRQTIVDAVGRGDFSAGCDGCGNEISVEGRAGSYAASFDRFATPRSGNEWPSALYLNLSNACNLQCVQCDGELSSSIRRHRERLPALARFADEAFFDELATFLPHLEVLEIAGGEPFLAPETFRTLEVVRRVAPGLRCRVITNGTQWNTRVQRALEDHRIDVTLSLDAISPELFSRIRVGAQLDEVLANLHRFIDHAGRAGTGVTISHCLMPQNAHEFGDLLEYAEALGVAVSVSVVRDPPEQSIVHLPPRQLQETYQVLLERDGEMSTSLRLNLETWRQELSRLRVWAGGDREGVRGHEEHRVMWFARAGDGPCDDRSHRVRLEDMAVDGRVFGLRVGYGQVVEEVDDALVALLGTPARDLVGSHIRTLMPALSAVFGEMRSMRDIRTLVESDDRVEQLAEFPAATLRMCTTPLRDRSGTAHQASVLFARTSVSEAFSAEPMP